jgi:hypothetical protein
VPDDPRLAIADAHANAVAARLAEALLAAIAPLPEPPRPYSRERALSLSWRLVDALAGFALGAALAPVIGCVRRAAGVDQVALRRALATATARYDVRARPSAALTPTGVVIADAAKRPLVDELGSQLHRRLLDGAADLRAVIAALLAPVPIAGLDALVADLGRANDDLAAQRFADQLAHGWATYTAELAGVAMPAIEQDRTRALWTLWRRRVRGERRVDPAASAPPLGEYIMRVA